MVSQTETINQVQSMLNKEEFISKNELLSKVKELGWKPVTLNYSLKVLRQQGVLIEQEKDGETMIKLGENQYKPAPAVQNNFRTQGYRTKKSRYQGEIPELTKEQEELKNLVNNNREALFNKKVMWTDGQGMNFPLTIAGMGDVTLRCRFYLADFMDSEPQTGAIVYIPWHDSRIGQLTDQIKNLLNPVQEMQECVNFAVTP